MEIFTHHVEQRREALTILDSQTVATCRAENGWHTALSVKVSYINRGCYHTVIISTTMCYGRVMLDRIDCIKEACTLSIDERVHSDDTQETRE